VGVRLPRFFAKKRGHRRTGSEAWGSFGEGLFHAVLVVAGLVFGGLLLTGVAVPEWRINHDFLPATATVVGKGLGRRPGPTGPTWQPCLLVQYQTDAGPDDPRKSWTFLGSPLSDRDRALTTLAGHLPLGSTAPCWYDPADPAAVVLSRGYNWRMWALTLLLPGALLAFGGAGLGRVLARWGKSEERRAAAATGPLGPLAGRPTEAAGYPGVPPCDDLVNSPGTVLRFRLPSSGPESWTLLGLGLFAALWNTVLVVLAVTAGLDLLGGRIDWLLLAVLVPFVAVGIAGIVIFAREFVLTTAVGTTQLEISDHPLCPGGRYEVLLAQGGVGEFGELALAIEVEEQATYRQGTDTRIERRVVWHRPLESWQNVQVAPGTRFEGRSLLELPASAMHSFASEHNAVSWRVVVRGQAARWPEFSRSFPVIVHPAAPPRGPRPEEEMP
jgi:hypothetical protein